MVQEFKPTIATYRTMVSELRKALAEQFPERKDIYIVDGSKSPTAEIANAAKELGIPDLAARVHNEYQKQLANVSAIGLGVKLAADSQRISGLALDVPKANGGKVWIVYGAGYRLDLDKLSVNTPIHPIDFAALTKVQVHELTHALMNDAHKKDHSNEHEYMANADWRVSETTAELVAIDVMMRHQLAYPGMVDSLIATYDKQRIYPTTDKFGPPQPYDPSTATYLLRKTYYQTPPSYLPQDFKGFSQLRDSFERSLRAIEATKDTATDTYARTSIDKVQSLYWQIAKQNKMNREQAEAWILGHADILPDTLRAKAGIEYLQAFSAQDAAYEKRKVPLASRQYPEYSEPQLKPSTEYLLSVVAAQLRYGETKNSLDRTVAQFLLEDLLNGDTAKILPPLELSENQKRALVAHPEYIAWAQRLEKGEKFEAVLADIRKTSQCLVSEQAETQALGALTPAPASSSPSSQSEKTKCY